MQDAYPLYHQKSSCTNTPPPTTKGKTNLAKATVSGRFSFFKGVKTGLVLKGHFPRREIGLENDSLRAMHSKQNGFLDSCVHSHANRIGMCKARAHRRSTGMARVLEITHAFACEENRDV